MGGSSLGLMVLLRYNITVAIVKMVNQTALYMEEYPNKTVDDFLAEGYHLSGEFDWNNEIQQMIMSVYMFAYTLPQVAGTKVAMKIGGRWATPISLSICGASTLLVPIAAFWSWKWVVALRLLNGLGATAINPMMIYLMEKWMPYDEFSLGLTCSQILQSILLAANPLFCGYLSSLHWSYAFYVPGGIALLFCVVWVTFITDQPDENLFISERELNLIQGCEEKNISEANLDTKTDHGDSKTNDNSDQSTNIKVTLMDILKTRTFYAYAFIWMFLCTSHVIFTFILPTYLRQFLKIGVVDNGTFCTIIMSGSLLANFWPHPLLRLLQTQFNLTLTASRRVIYAIICIMSAGTWNYVGLFHSDQLLMLFINRCFQASTDIIVAGSLMSNYSKAGVSSLVFSMVNTVGNLSITVASPLVGYVLDHTGQSVAGWSWIYYALGIPQLLMLLPFVTTIRSEPLQFPDKVCVNKNPEIFITEDRINKQVLDGFESTQVVVVDKLDGTLRKNFDKLREVKKTNSNSSSDNGIMMKI